MGVIYKYHYEYKGFKLGETVKYKRYVSDKYYSTGKIIGFCLDEDAVFPVWIKDNRYKDVIVKDRLCERSDMIMLPNVEYSGFCCVQFKAIKQKNINKKVTYKDYISEIKKIMSIWKDSYIDSKFELILEERRNIYINLNMYNTPRELKYNMLCWKSRPCIKGDDEKYLNSFRKKFNEYFEQNWSLEDVELIYQIFGNECNSELCWQFIDSDYDMEVLRFYGKN